MQSDDFFMRKALKLARKGEGKVLPNPMVGALIVRDGEVLGEGWHARYGGIHAEAAALDDCRKDPAGATLYVTLEPCCHSSRGKHNPPCTQAILQSGISRVVIARPDPNPEVSGKGIRVLRDKGISVTAGILEKEAAHMNRIYETLIRESRPYIHLKAAVSLDGFLAASDGSSKWISGPESREHVMRFRSGSDGILTGKGTLFTDRPSLTVRNSENSVQKEDQPVRIFLSTRGELPAEWNKEGGPVLVYHHQSHPAPVVEGRECRFCPVPGDQKGLSLPDVLGDLRNKNIHRLLVEGGSKIFGSFLRSQLWDRLTIFVAPILLGEGIPFSDGLEIPTMASKLKLKDLSSTLSGKDVMINGYREAISCLQA